MDTSTPASSQVSDLRRLTALAEVHWARRVQAPMPQISGPNLQVEESYSLCLITVENGGASWTLTLSSTSSTRPQLEEAVL
jgi:hypothetical protein